MQLTLEQAEKFVDQNDYAEWQGWEIKIYEPSANGFLRKNGAFRNGQWHTVYTAEINNDGQYFIPKKYFNRIRY